MGALLARARAAACLLGLTSLRSILGDSAILLSEPNDFDEVCRAAAGRHLRTAFLLASSGCWVVMLRTCPFCSPGLRV